MYCLMAETAGGVVFVEAIAFKQKILLAALPEYRKYGWAAKYWVSRGVKVLRESDVGLPVAKPPKPPIFHHSV